MIHDQKYDFSQWADQNHSHLLSHFIWKEGSLFVDWLNDHEDAIFARSGFKFFEQYLDLGINHLYLLLQALQPQIHHHVFGLL